VTELLAGAARGLLAIVEDLARQEPRALELLVQARIFVGHVDVYLERKKSRSVSQPPTTGGTGCDKKDAAAAKAGFFMESSAGPSAD
jgi:hypothetical protein